MLLATLKFLLRFNPFPPLFLLSICILFAIVICKLTGQERIVDLLIWSSLEQMAINGNMVYMSLVLKSTMLNI